MRIELCPECNNWRRNPEIDVFCGSCKADLVRLQAKLAGEHQLFYQNTQLPETINIYLSREMGRLEKTELLWKRAHPPSETEFVCYTFETEALEVGEITTFPFSLSELEINPSQEEYWQLIHRIEDRERVITQFKSGVAFPKVSLTEKELLFSETLEDNTPILTLQHVGGGELHINHITFAPVTHGLDEYGHPEIHGIPATGLVLNDVDSVFQIPKIEITETLHHYLKSHPLGVKYRVLLSSENLSDPIQLKEIKLRVPSPARPELYLPSELKVLEKRELGIPLEIENLGGEKFEAKGFQIKVLQGKEKIWGKDITYPLSLASAIRKEINLCVPFDADSQDMPQAGSYVLHVSIINIEGQFHKPEKTFLQIEPLEKFKGIVTIDFGTTATAAAVHHLNPNRAPVSIPLTRHAAYIPTAVAYFIDESENVQFVIGHEAEQVAADLPPEHVAYIDNIKWKLRGRQDVSGKWIDTIRLPDGNTKSWVDVAVDFLSVIKQRIENSDVVMSEIKRVCVTQPARYDLLLSKLLLNAYRRAGMSPIQLRAGVEKNNITTISESWPTAVLAIPEKRLQQWQRNTIGSGKEKSIAPEESGNHNILTIDIGGGSSDFSLMGFFNGGKDKRLTELEKGGDNQVAGNYFSRLLFESLEIRDKHGNLLEKVGDRDYPILPPWAEGEYGLSQIARETGKKNWHILFNKVIRRLQFQFSERGKGKQGVFELDEVLLYLDKLPDDYWLPKNAQQNNFVISDEVEGGENKTEEYIKYIGNAIKYEINTISFELQHVHLSYGSPFSVAKGGDQLHFNHDSFFQKFRNNVASQYYSSFQSLLGSTQDTDYPLYCLITGRGSLFPIMPYMLQSILRALWAERDDKGVRFVNSGSKTVISSGGCYIVNLLSGMDKSLIFEPEPLRAFGVHGLDDLGESCFIPICNGMLEENDGLIALDWDCQSFVAFLQIEFYMNSQGDTLITEKSHRLGHAIYDMDEEICQEITGKEKCFLLIRMKAEGDIEVAVGYPDPEKEDASDLEQWIQHPFDSFTPRVEDT